MGGAIHKISHLNLSEALNPSVPQTRTHAQTRERTHTVFGSGTDKKAKESCNRPGVAQRVPGGLGSQIFMTFGT